MCMRVTTLTLHLLCSESTARASFDLPAALCSIKPLDFCNEVLIGNFYLGQGWLKDSSCSCKETKYLGQNIFKLSDETVTEDAANMNVLLASTFVTPCHRSPLHWGDQNRLISPITLLRRSFLFRNHRAVECRVACFVKSICIRLFLSVTTGHS